MSAVVNESRSHRESCELRESRDKNRERTHQKLDESRGTVSVNACVSVLRELKIYFGKIWGQAPKEPSGQFLAVFSFPKCERGELVRYARTANLREGIKCDDKRGRMTEDR